MAAKKVADETKKVIESTLLDFNQQLAKKVAEIDAKRVQLEQLSLSLERLLPPAKDSPLGPKPATDLPSCAFQPLSLESIGVANIENPRAPQAVFADVLGKCLEAMDAKERELGQIDTKVRELDSKLRGVRLRIGRYSSLLTMGLALPEVSAHFDRLKDKDKIQKQSSRSASPATVPCGSPSNSGKPDAFCAIAHDAELARAPLPEAAPPVANGAGAPPAAADAEPRAEPPSLPLAAADGCDESDSAWVVVTPPDSAVLPSKHPPTDTAIDSDSQRQTPSAVKVVAHDKEVAAEVVLHMERDLLLLSLSSPF